MDAVHGGTGVFYQAMPAVGADGKNIMKLIPVQMVNGQLVQTQISDFKIDSTPQKSVTINIAPAPVQMVKKATLNPSATQQVVRKQASHVNTLPNQVGLDLCNSLNKQPLQQHTINLMAKVPGMATPATNCEESVRPQSQLPVTVKSPALPRGQYLQIPPNAQVRTVPASELPPGIKKQIFTSSSSSPPGSGLPSVVYVSPITTVNQDVSLPNDSVLHSLKLPSKTSNETSHQPLSKEPKPHLKLIPKLSQRPNSPIRWTIEEEECSNALTRDALHSPSVTSEILRAVAERENANKHCNVITKSVSQLTQDKSGQGQEDALVVCNGKVFYVAKKCSLPLKMGKSNSPTAATKCNEFNKTMAPSSQPSFESVAPEIRQDLRIIIPDESDEVIDLCDDDAQDDSSQQAASVNMSAVTHIDEDNVIFVSYIPPKSESTSAQHLKLKTQMAFVKESDQMGTSCSHSVTQQKSLDGTVGGDGREEVSALGGRKPGQSMSVSTVENLTHVCSSAVMNMHENVGSVINSQSTSRQHLESMEVDVATESPADRSSGICSRIEKDIHKTESSMTPTTSGTSSLEPKSCQMADHLLRQIFRITADVKVCLKRIDEASAVSVPAEPLQSESPRSVKDHHESSSVLHGRELFLQALYDPQGPDSDSGVINVKRVKVLAEQGLTTDPATPSPHTHSGLLKCSHIKLDAKTLSALKCNAGQSSLRETSCDVVTEPVVGYVEPIDEDFLSSEDTDARPQRSIFVDLNTNTRIGRMRKRTICPCCIPGTRNSAFKSTTKSVEPEKSAWTTGQMSKKAVRPKPVRKYVKTSGRINCLTAKNKQNCKTYEVPASDSLSTTSMDCNESKQHKEIKRLKELLREKEAALELLRKRMI